MMLSRRKSDLTKVPALALIAFALIACTENPVKSKLPGGGAAKNLLQTSGTQIADFHKNVSSLDKIGDLMAGPGSDIKVKVGLQGIGGGKTAGSAGGKPKVGPSLNVSRVAGGILGLAAAKTLTLRTPKVRRAMRTDSTWWVLEDSSQGFVYEIHEFTVDDSISPWNGRDSTVYGWPHDEMNPVVKLLHNAIQYQDGTRWWSVYLDVDGDGILHSAANGQAAQVRQITVQTRKDTTWKTETYTDHGIISTWDGFWSGKVKWTADSSFIKGKVVWWGKSFDGDGDGFVSTANAGTQVKARYESWSDNFDGNYYAFSASYGVGPDLDFDTWEDNEYFPYASYTLNARGDTLGWSTEEDDDGDGILNGCPAGKTVLIKRVNTGKSGDTTWKSISYSDHGKVTRYDSLGEGKAIWWTDTNFAKGKAYFWQITRDGDGDGFVTTAAGSGAIKVRNDSWTRNEDGSVSFNYNTWGAGADRDYFKWEDNEQWPSLGVSLAAKGDTLSRNQFGDSDGDGIYYSPAAGAVNKVWEVNQYASQNEYKSYRDSVVKLLKVYNTFEDDQVVYYQADVAYLDGSTSFITTKAKNGTDGFSEKDTIETREKYTFVNYKPKDSEDRIGDQDSSVRVTHMIPNKLTDWEDDQIAWWSSKTYYKKGMLTLYSSEVLTAKRPFLSGKEPEAGILIREERYSASTDHEVARYHRLEDFDNPKGTTVWREVRFLGNGDSTVEAGGATKDEGTYAKDLDANTRNTGWYSSATNEFRDTIVYKNAKGTEPARDISWGVYKDEDATGDYWQKQILANGDSSVSRTFVVKEGEEKYKITSITGSDTSTYKTNKDTVQWDESDGKVRTTFSSVGKEDGSYAILQSSYDIATSNIVLTGQFFFSPDGSGAGTMVEYKDKVAQTPITLKFGVDGSVYVNGVKVPDDPMEGSGVTAVASK